MGRIIVFLISICITFMTLLIFVYPPKKESFLEPVTRDLINQIENLDLNCSNSVDMVNSWLEINKSIKSVSNKSERMIVCKRLKDSVLSVDLVKKTDYQKSCLIGVYWQILHLLGRSMLECEVSDSETQEYIIKGWTKYRDMCFSFGDENDFNDGNGIKARNRRARAKTMRQSYLNDLIFFERNSIRLLYLGFPEDKKKAFLNIWHKKFGQSEHINK